MEELRQKFMTICTGCDGTGEYEEPIGGFENEVTYKTTKCDCENGKEFDWDKLYKETNETKKEIESLNVNILVHNQLIREYLEKDLIELCISSLRELVKYEKKIEVKEEYLAQLEEF